MCIAIHILSPDSDQYTPLLWTCHHFYGSERIFPLNKTAKFHGEVLPRAKLKKKKKILNTNPFIIIYLFLKKSIFGVYKPRTML